MVFCLHIFYFIYHSSKNDYEAAARTRKDDTALLFYHSCLSSPSDYGQYVGGGSTAPADSNESTRLRPFIDAHKYKAFVLPRILHLFTMHITPIRIMLLQYFPFYIDLIDDKYMLEHELLPEVSNLPRPQPNHTQLFNVISI